MTPPHRHNFHTSIPDYEVCSICGTLHRISNIAPDSVYAESYWNREGYSTIQEQVYNVSEFRNESGETKIESVLKYISESCENALEIACAPGSALRALREASEDVWGIEYSDQYKDEIMDISGVTESNLIFGPYPESTKGTDKKFKFILAMDFFEHIEDGQGVMNEVFRQLTDGGTAVFMSPFLFDDGLYRECDRHPEHRWLYSQSYLKEWMGSMFSEVKFDRWQVGHELLILKK